MANYTPDSYDDPEFERIAKVINGQLDVQNLYGQEIEVFPQLDGNDRADPMVDIIVPHDLAAVPRFIINTWNPQGAQYATREATTETVTFRIDSQGKQALRFLLLPETT